MFYQILGYLRNEYDDLDFTAWEVVAAVVLPNQKKSRQQHDHEDHFVLSKEDLVKIENQENDIFDLLRIRKKIWIPEEYEAIATVFMASMHSAGINPKGSNPVLKAMPVESEEAHAALAGKDAADAGPGFDQKLVDDVQDGILKTGVTHNDITSNQKLKKEKTGINSLASWIFWSPDQFEIIRSKPARLLITGKFGCGKTMILMALALEARQAGKRVGFMSCTNNKDSILNQTMENFCMENEITFVQKEVFAYIYRRRGADPGWKHDYSTLHETLDWLYIDEIPPVSNINKKVFTPW